ncbi:hypothetical protein [Streptomyces sp. NPDC059009]|uniref:hypothetical protein n=1 Tax=Streptomyces sp. NPDC059009 TaxID=3346694 RepID=UPI0036D0B812
MSSGHKTMTLFVTVILGLIFIILGLSASWPAWAWPASGALLLVIAAVTHRVLAPGPSALPSGPEAAPDLTFFVERPEQRVAYVALPSAVPDYDFSFSATVMWTLLEAPEDAPEVNPAGLAVDAVLQRARTVAAEQEPTRAAFVQHQLDGALGTMRMDATGRVMAMARDVSLGLPEHDRERLLKLSNVRKDEEVWEHERNYERNKRAYLGDDVLRDTGSAVVWWLSRNDEEVEGAVDRIGLLARLSAAANNEDVSPPFEHLVPPPPFATAAADRLEAEQPFSPDESRLNFDDAFTKESGPPASSALDAFLEWFGFSPDDPELDLFAERLINIAQAHGKTDIAEEIRRRFGPDEPGDQPTEFPA